MRLRNPGFLLLTALLAAAMAPSASAIACPDGSENQFGAEPDATRQSSSVACSAVENLACPDNQSSEGVGPTQQNGSIVCSVVGGCSEDEFCMTLDDMLATVAGDGGQTVSVCNASMQVCSIAGASAAKDRVAGVPGHPVVLLTTGHGQSNNQYFGANVDIRTSLASDNFNVEPMSGEGRLWQDIKAADSDCPVMQSTVRTSLNLPTVPLSNKASGLVVAVAVAEDSICETV